MSEIERIDSSFFSPLSLEEQEMVLGGLAQAVRFTYSGSAPTYIDGVLHDVPEYTSDPVPVPADPVPADPGLIA